MAGLVRAKDWSKTPLGSIESWPQSLRTAVSLCLGSRHPIALWWGPERWMFYNDGYRPMLGARKHPQFLGASGRECWAEIWDIVGPMMDQVIETGEATWSEDLFLLMLRHGYLEETYFTFSYSPIRDEAGKPNGIFCAVDETTARILADRRLRTVREMSVEAETVDDAATRCAEILGKNPKDLPFALLYVLDDAGAHLELAGSAGLDRGTPASPSTVAIAGSDEGSWPLARVAKSERVEIVDDLATRFDCLPTEPWDEPVHQAVVLPIERRGAHVPAGVLVLGINPRRALDDDYRGFLDLVAGRIAAALANSRALQQERERAEKLAELDRAKTVFFGNISHEFRTPLTLLIGPLEDALADPANALRGDSLAAVHRNALRLSRLVNSLLEFARVEAGRSDSSFEPTDLAVLTAGLAGSFQSLFEPAGLKLTVDCPRLAEPVFVDRGQWEKIVLNLVSNAFKFTFEGEIAVRLRGNAAHVELSVSDTGTGIPAEEIPKLFDRFHRVDGARSRSIEGTGLGLALVHELVRNHGGSVRVESVVGQGSTFVVSIPRGADHLPKDRITSGDEAPAGPDNQDAFLLEAAGWGAMKTIATEGAPIDAPPSRSTPAADVCRKARVLVADDNNFMREYLVRLLSTRWRVEAVADGEAALQAALRERPDLLVSDVMMPVMDGIALLKALRADVTTSTIPVILLSARAGEEAVLAGLDTGADDYLVKPFSPRELVSRVGTHLELARIRRAAEDTAKELAETRATLLEELERKNHELEAFSYSVSHDLRTPLGVIVGFSEMLLKGQAGALDARGKDSLQEIPHCRKADGAAHRRFPAALPCRAR